MSTTETVDAVTVWFADSTDDQLTEAVAFGVFVSSAVWASADQTRNVDVARRAWDRMPVEDRARWLQRGRDTITYALGYVP